ncbi:hypothetical protein Hanom_Chr01g00043701 [Helianthus anomalus]
MLVCLANSFMKVAVPKKKKKRKKQCCQFPLNAHPLYKHIDFNLFRVRAGQKLKTLNM